jgi:O-antigen/teichoic acid export membrane protein
MRRQVLALSAANAMALGLGGLAYVAYSGILTPAQFGLYGIAFALARFAVLVLDGGLKTAVIKHPADLSAAQETSLTLLSGALACVLLLAAWVAASALPAVSAITPEDATFCATFVAVYVATYPLMVVPTAQLERAMRYVPLSAIESVAIALELAGAAPLLVTTDLGIWSFVVAAAAGRALRVAALLAVRGIRWARPEPGNADTVKALLKEGAWFQGSLAASMLRDNLHVLIIAPWFGKAWAGYYAWALQLAMFSSQVFVATASRIAIPAHAGTPDFDTRWKNTLVQMRWLAALTVPVLAAVWLLAPAADAAWFEGRWQPAVALLALIFARMLPGIGTSPLGSLVLVERGAAALMRANIAWTAIELAGALVACLLLGPTGLAWSYAILVWAGFAILLAGLPNAGSGATREALGAILNRPALWVSVAGAASIGYLLGGPFAADIPGRSWDANMLAAAAGGLVVIGAGYAAEFAFRRTHGPAEVLR